MVFTLRAQAASSYALTRLKDGSSTNPSLGFANTQSETDSTGFYLESPGNGIGIVGGDGTATHPTLNFGYGKGVYATDSGLGLTGGGSLEGAVIQHHPSGRVWRSHSVPNGSYLNIIWVDELGLFVTANTSTGHIVTSKDGETWTSSNVGVTAWDLAWSPTLKILVAVGTDAVWTSPDAVTWTQQTAPSGAWVSVTWAPSANAFVALRNSTVMISSDGIQWTLSGASFYNAIYSKIRSNDEILIVGGEYTIYTSVDGITWTNRVFNFSYQFQDFAFSSDLGVWVSVGRRGNAIARSTDGISWSIQSLSDRSTSVAWCDRQFVATYITHTQTSPDGITWTRHDNVLPGTGWVIEYSPTLQRAAVVPNTGNTVQTSDARTTLDIPGDLNVTGTLTSQTVKAGVTVTKIQITDNAWQAIDDTALDTATGGYLVVTGRDFASGVVARVGPTTASSTAFISSTELRIQLPAKAAGTYPLELVHSDGTVTTIPNAITYSPFPTWITDGSLAGTSANGMPFSFEIASSDSALGVVTANATYPVGTTVAPTPEGNTVAISGTITAPTTDTLYSFDATVEDAENQDLATKTWQLQHAATYHSQHLGNAVVQSFTTASDSATIDASSDTLTDTTGNVVAASSAAGSTAVTAAGNVLDGNASTVWTTAATYDAADGSYTGAVSTTVEGNAVLGEYLDLAFDQAQTITHLAIRPLDGSTAAVPVTFTVAGNNGGTWTLVHSQASAVPLADGTETVVALDTPGSYSSYRVIAQTVGVGEDSITIAGVRTWADGLPLLSYAHPITLVNGHVMARVGTTAVMIDPSGKATTIAVGLTPTAKPALLADASVFWPPAVGYTIGYRVASDGTVTTVSGIAADVSNAVLQADGTVLMLPSSGTTAQTYDPSSGAVANVTAYSLPGGQAILEPAAVPGGVLALPNKAASGSLVQNGTVTTTTALFGANYNESKLVAIDPEAGFETSVAISGDGTRMVAGIRDDNSGSGAAYVFSLVNGVWTETKLVPSDSEGNAEFGYSCSMNATGTRVVIGTQLDDATGGTDSGAAYVFSLVNGAWVEDTKLIPSDSEGNARFGSSVSMNADGDRVVIGAFLDDATGGTNSGAAYVFSFVDGAWVEDAKLVPNDSEAYARFGWSCSMNASGNRVVIGAYVDDATDSGAAYVFSLVNGAWVEYTKLIPSDSEANASFGWSCSMNESGDRVVIGANLDDATGGTDSGAAYVFSLVNGSWVEDTKLIPSDSEGNVYFGYSCSMNASGDRVVIGVVLDDATGGADSGAAYVFDRDGTSWTQKMKLVPSDSQVNAQFGFSASISSDGSRVLVGDRTGAAYVYDLSSAGQLVASGNALVAKGSTVKAYDLDGDTVTSTTYLPTTVSDLTILDDGRILATSAHDTAMTYDPVSGNVTSLQGPRSLGRATRLLDGKVWTEGGLVFQSGSSVSTPLTATIGLSSFVNP